MPQIGPAEILVVLLVAMLVFGPKRLPEIGRQIGRGIHEVKKFQTTITNEIEGAIHAADVTAAPEVKVDHEVTVDYDVKPPVMAPRPAPVRSVGPSARPPSRFRAPESASSTQG